MQAAVIAILLMSSVSANAMEFGDRPGLSSPTVSHTVASVDRSRRQIDALAQFKISGLKLADRRRPISNVNHKRLASLPKDGPGRLSPEFTVVSGGPHIRLDVRHAVSIPRKPVTMIMGMKFEDRPGSMATPNSVVRLQSVAPPQHVTVLALRGR